MQIDSFFSKRDCWMSISQFQDYRFFSSVDIIYTEKIDATVTETRRKSSSVLKLINASAIKCKK